MRGIFLFTLLISITLIIPSKLCFSNPNTLNKKITLNIKNETLGTALKKIENQLDVRFFFLSDIIDINQKLSADYNSVSLSFILGRLISSSDVLIYIDDDTIIFYKKNDKPPGTTGTSYELIKYEDKQQKKQINKPLTETQKIVIYDSIKVHYYDTVAIYSYDTLLVTQYDTIKWVETLNYDLIFNIAVNSYGGFPRFTDNILQTNYKFSETELDNIFSFGIGISAYKENIAFKTGLDFLRKTGKVKYDYSIIKIDPSQILRYETQTTITTTKIITTGPGAKGKQNEETTETVTDSIPRYKTDTIMLDYIGSKSVLYASIPLILSYTLDINSTFSSTIGTGLNCNILMGSKGYSLGSDYRLHPIKDTYRNIYLSSISELCIEYALNKNQKIGIIMGYLFSLTDVTNEKSAYFSDEKRFFIKGTFRIVL